MLEETHMNDVNDATRCCGHRVSSQRPVTQEDSLGDTGGSTVPYITPHPPNIGVKAK